MELYDLVFAILSLVMGSGVLIYGLSKRNLAEKGKKTSQDSISSMYSTYNQQVKDVLDLKDKQIKRLNNKIQQLEPDTEQDQTNTPLELGSLEKVLTERGINPALLKNPLVQKYIKKYTKGMGIEEIIALADQFGFLKGGKKPESKDPLSIQNTSGFF